MSDNLFKTLDRELSIKSTTPDTNRIKYIDSNELNFKDLYYSGNKMSQNYDLETENNLIYGYDSRRNSSKHNTGISQNNDRSDMCKDGMCRLPKSNKSTRSTTNMNSILDLNINQLINTDSTLKLGSFIKPNTNAPTSLKDSEIYWDNTRRRNLDTAIYTDNPTKVGGRGFGNISKYDLLLNGIGLSTRQENPDVKPQNIDNDRIYLPHHNYNYSKFHISNNLECGADTRFLNKKMMN